jgi:uncharacterized lipoprotein YmbA
MIDRRIFGTAGRAAALLSMTGLLLAGCLGRSPEVGHFVLGAGVAVQPSGDGTSDLAVLVGPVRLPAYLERPQIARLEPGGEVELDEFNRWLGGFRENLLRSVSLDLATRLGSVRVVAHPSYAPFPFDYRVRLHVDDFVFVRDEQAIRARIRWALIREGGEDPAGLFLLERTVPVDSDSVENLVAAHVTVLSDLASKIAIEMAHSERLSSPPAP